MKRHDFFVMLALGCLLLTTTSAIASSEIEALAVEIDKANQGIDANSRRITETFVQLEKRVADFSGQITYIKQASSSIEDKYEKIIGGLEAIKTVQASLQGIKVTQAKHEEKFSSLATDIVRLEKEIAVSQQIISWVTAIVSVVVILIGLFFSRRFLELYANYRVICSRFPKEERDGMGLTES